jgi:hypothetical protein
MAVGHYGYLVLKMTSPKGILKIRGTVTWGFLRWRSSKP